MLRLDTGYERDSSGHCPWFFALSHPYKRSARSKKLFADDKKLFSSIREVQNEVRLQGNVNNSENWAQIWNMDFNTKNQPTQPYTMTSGSQTVTLEQLNQRKDL